MKRVSKLCGLISKPLQEKYLAASESERRQLQTVVEAGKERMIRKLASKGYELEAVVGDIYGLFTRGPARGTVRLVKSSAETAVPAL